MNSTDWTKVWDSLIWSAHKVRPRLWRVEIKMPYPYGGIHSTYDVPVMREREMRPVANRILKLVKWKLEQEEQEEQQHGR